MKISSEEIVTAIERINAGDLQGVPLKHEQELTRREFGIGVAGASLALSITAVRAADPSDMVSPGNDKMPPTKPEPTLPTMRAGVAAVVVTPAADTFLIGPMKPATGVHDDLYARLLILDDNEHRAALVTLDYLGFDFAYNDVLLAAVSKAAGIPPEHVFINCSHTHSAPLTAPWGPWEKAKDRPFHAELPKKLAELTRKAVDGLRPVVVRYRREPTQIGFNRRLFSGDRIVMAPNPDGPVLPWVDLLSIEEPDGKPLALFFSHAAHPVIVHAHSTLISADYPGFAVAHLKDSHRYPGIAMFAQGCCGDINAFPLKGGIEAAKAAGRDLAAAVHRGLESKPAPLEAVRLNIVSSELSLPLQPPPSPARCRQMLEQEKDEERRRAYAELLKIAESGETRTMRFPMRALTLGRHFCLLAFAHDTFSHYHRFVERISPFSHNMVLAYTNGLECYVGTEKDYELGERGGYETSPRGAAQMFESRLPLAAESQDLIENGIRKLFQKVIDG